MYKSVERLNAEGVKKALLARLRTLNAADSRKERDTALADLIEASMWYSAQYGGPVEASAAVLNGCASLVKLKRSRK